MAVAGRETGPMRLSRTLSSYVGRQFLIWFAGATVFLVCTIFVFDFVELLRRTAQKEDIGFAGVAGMALLKLPMLTERAIPFSALLGAMFAFWRLNRHHEFVVARAAGVSIWQFLLPPIALAVLIGLIKIAVFNPFSSAMLLKYEVLEAQHIRGKSSLAALANQGLWFRQPTAEGHYILHAVSIVPSETRLRNVIVFMMDTSDRFVSRIDASDAVLEPQAWRIEGATVTRPNSAPTEVGELRIPTDLTRANIEDSFAPPETISFWELPGFIKVLEKAGFSGIRHLIYWHIHLALPLLLASVIVLAANFSLRPTRRGGTAFLMVCGIGTGFLIYFLSDVVYALGVSSKIPAIMAAWSPAVITMLLSAAMLFHLEDG